MEDSETDAMINKTRLLEIEGKEWEVRCVAYLDPESFVPVECSFSSHEENPIEESFMMTKSSGVWLCNEKVNAEPGFCTELVYRLAKHMDIQIYQSSTETEIRDATEIASEIKSYLVSATQECISTGTLEKDCGYNSTMLETRSGFIWNEHKYYIGVGLIMLFVAVFFGLLTMKMLRKRRQGGESRDISSEDSLLTSNRACKVVHA